LGGDFLRGPAPLPHAGADWQPLTRLNAVKNTWFSGNVGFIIKQNLKKTLPSARGAPIPGAPGSDCLHCLPCMPLAAFWHLDCPNHFVWRLYDRTDHNDRCDLSDIRSFDLSFCSRLILLTYRKFLYVSRISLLQKKSADFIKTFVILGLSIRRTD